MAIDKQPLISALESVKAQCATSETWARFVLSDGRGTVYECRNRVASCRVEIFNSEVTRFYEGGPISRAECVAAINELRRVEYERFLKWASDRKMDVSEYGPPKPIV